MKLSERFGLKKSQFELDFVDIDIDEDLPLFIDPHFISNLNGIWAEDCMVTIESFFGYLIQLIRQNKIAEAEELFEHLNEPNETCLGMSRGVPDGRGVGEGYAQKILNQILKSKAVTSGIVQDLQDCVIFVEGFGPDRLSDMTTNIIRKHLIEYTKDQCNLLGIPLTKNVQSGFYWDGLNSEWTNEHTEMLVIDNRKILLVPKTIVSYCDVYTSGKYHNRFVLEFLQRKHKREKTPLVQYRKGKNGKKGEAFVTKKSLIKEAPHEKDYLRKFTLKHPEIFKNFKEQHSKPVVGLPNEKIMEASGKTEDDQIIEICNHLISRLKKIPSGVEHAGEFHTLIIGILELLFYPNLSNPKKEDKIHAGRKRIDITFVNTAVGGFFNLLSGPQDIPCRLIFVECKNYSKDICNPELDQLSGRFSNQRGKVGIVVCRKVDNEVVLMKRCKDTWRDDRGLLLYLTDKDLIKCLKDFALGKGKTIETILDATYLKILKN